MIRIQSSGLGIQSMALSLMSFDGLLPKLDHIIFADTGWENPVTHEACEYMRRKADENGVQFHVVRSGNIYSDSLSFINGEDNGRWASMPMFIQDVKGKISMLRRQCTNEYKIKPIELFIKRELLGLKKYERAPKEPVIEKWFGISMDEAIRMRTPSNKWEEYRYPLIYDLGMSRGDCAQYVNDKHPDAPLARSSCIGCPYHDDREWQWIKDNFPGLFEEACEYDEAIRVREGMVGKSYLHRSCRPLREIDFRTLEERGQINMFGNDCSGMCGV